jgi:hypothetical protein
VARSVPLTSQSLEAVQVIRTMASNLRADAVVRRWGSSDRLADNSPYTVGPDGQQIPVAPSYELYATGIKAATDADREILFRLAERLRFPGDNP